MMKAGTAALGLAVVVVVLVAIGVNSFPRVATGDGRTAQPQLTTIEQVISGRYPSGLDKQGTGGVTVEVRGLTVLYVNNESDGDWHVAVRDRNVSVFITEIIPRDQAALGRPAPGSLIDEVGVPYCDVQHENESWHGDTCWEIHPVTAWSLSA